jgi:hypothetical protein
MVICGKIAASTASKIFEIGDASNYTPITLAFASATNGTGNLTAFTTAGDHPSIVSSTINQNKNVNRYWTITNGGVTGVNPYSATFTFVAGDLDAGANTSAFFVEKYDGSPSWIRGGTGGQNLTNTQGTDLHHSVLLQWVRMQMLPLLQTNPVSQTKCAGSSVSFYSGCKRSTSTNSAMASEYG